MKKIAIIFVPFLILSGCTAFAQEKQTIAVLPLESEEQLTSLSTTVADRFQTELFRIHFFKLVDRNSIAALFREQGLTLTGVIDSESSVKVGRMLSAQKVLTGSLRTTQSKYFITVNIIDVETGRIDYSDHLTVQQEDDVLKNIPLMVDRIRRVFLKEKEEYNKKFEKSINKALDLAITASNMLQHNRAKKILNYIENFELKKMKEGTIIDSTLKLIRIQISELDSLSNENQKKMDDPKVSNNKFLMATFSTLASASILTSQAFDEILKKVETYI
ncbi:CsgG/HfaB family protein [bacterium]|nr:CsgG/HfaB family protein [bacterium]